MILHLGGIWFPDSLFTYDYTPTVYLGHDRCVFHHHITLLEVIGQYKQWRTMGVRILKFPFLLQISDFFPNVKYNLRYS